jgi:hypothetical protein
VQVNKDRMGFLYNEGQSKESEGAVMPFALTAVQLDEAMKKPGCPVCRLAEESVQKSASGFLYENSMNPEVRQPIIEARGFCPDHTLLLVAVEMSSSGPVLGINYIYEQLARLVADELTAQKPSVPGFSKVLKYFQPSTPPLPVCPLCEHEKQSATNLLQALFEELEEDTSVTRNAYAQSEGLCYSHLTSGLRENSPLYPASSKFLIDQTKERLTAQSAEMREYIRKHDWHYRDEKISPSELTAWKKVLTFFTGLPEYQFNHKIEKR